MIEYLRVSLYMKTLTAMHVRHSRVSGSENSNQQDKEALERHQGSSDITEALPRLKRPQGGKKRARKSKPGADGKMICCNLSQGMSDMPAVYK